MVQSKSSKGFQCKSRRYFAVFLTLLLVTGMLPIQSFASPILLDGTAAVAVPDNCLVIDGDSSDWNMIPSVNATAYPGSFVEGAVIDSILVSNDQANLYVKVKGMLPSWGEDGMFLDLAFDIVGRDESNGIKTGPWSYQYNFNNTEAAPDFHIMARIGYSDNKLKYASVVKGGSVILTTDDLNGASFTMSLGSLPVDDSEYGGILTAVIPLEKLGLATGDKIRAIAVISGNSAGHGAFDVFPKAMDNQVAADWDSSASQQSMSTYSDCYELTGSYTDVPAEADYIKLKSDDYNKTVPVSTALKDLHLYSDGYDLFFYLNADSIQTENESYPIVLALNKNEADAESYASTVYSPLFDFSADTVKPQYYLQYTPSTKEILFYDTSSDIAADHSDIEVIHTSSGIEGKIPLSKLALVQDDTIRLWAMWEDGSKVISVSPFGRTNQYTPETGKSAIGMFSNKMVIPAPLGEKVELIPDTFTDLGEESWYVLGDLTASKWSPADTNKLNRIVDKLYAVSYILNPNTYEFKFASAKDGTINWDSSIGVDSSTNFKLKIKRKSVVTFYIRTDTKKAWIKGYDEYGTSIDTSNLISAGSNLSIYIPPFIYNAGNWPRLVGTIQSDLDGTVNWDTAATTLKMYDYDMNGTVFKYEGNLPGKSDNFEYKVLCGDSWIAPNYGIEGGNALISVPAVSKVVFAINLSDPNPQPWTTVSPLLLEIVSKDFLANGVKKDTKSFQFTFSENISLSDSMDISKSVELTPGLAVKSVVIDTENLKNLIVTLADAAALEYNQTYSIKINAGYFKSGTGLTNAETSYSFTVEDKPDEGPVTADEFIGLDSEDLYVIAGNFQKLAGDTGNWVPASKVTEMKRITGHLYAYSIVLPASTEAEVSTGGTQYEFKVVKNGAYDDPGSFSDSVSGGNFTFTLTEQTKVTFFVNAETHKLVSTAVIPHIETYYYNSKKLPRLLGTIQEQFGEIADDFEGAKQLFYDYYLDGSEFRLERKLQPADEYTAKAAVNKNDSISYIGAELKFPVSRTIDTTFKIKDNVLSQEFNIYEPVFAIDSVPANLQIGSEKQFSAVFKNEFKETSVLDSVNWSLKTPVAGVEISNTGLLKIADTVPIDTMITVIAEYEYTEGFTQNLNKTYRYEAEIKVVPVVTNFKVNYLRYGADYTDWNLWVWLDGQEGSGYKIFSEKDGWYSGVVSIPARADKINFITRKGEWADQEGGNRVFDLALGEEIWIVQGDKTVYYNKEDALKPKIFSAIMNSKNRIDFTVSESSGEINFSNFAVTSNGKKVSCVAAKGESPAKGVITLLEELKPSDLVEIIDLTGVYNSKIVTMRGVLDSYYYAGNDLGYTKQNGTDSFKVWAPTAKKVSLALYQDAGSYNQSGEVIDHTPSKIEEMAVTEQTGVWSALLTVPTEYPYYMYMIEFADGTINYAVDPYATAVAANGQRTAIVDLAATNPENWHPDSKPATITYATDHILYELHVRDFSIDPNASFENKGKFLAFTETGLKDSAGNTIGIDHLKELGVTTVHLLPSYDFKTVNELTVDDPNSADRKYNWGYDPQNYNVPEGAYSSNPQDPKARITEFKQMVQALHDADIRVVMDVVYNHTFDIATGPFDKIVPGYFYRFTSSGEISNGSGCGNEVATENLMVRKYVIDSVKYWAKEYNVDGFRFDLMGLIDQTTASQLTKELQEQIDPSMIVYGEPWKAADSPLTNGVSKGSQKNQSYALFNDDIRGAVKGGSDDTSKGFATGQSGKEGNVVIGLWGSTDSISGFTQNPSETINYITAHDNLNLWDKVIVSQGLDQSLNMLYHKMKDGSMLDGSSVDEAVASSEPYRNVDLNNPFADETVKRSILANAMILTMQGVPFIHAGDEFLRTKYGDHNSYRSPDSVNMIRWENKAKFKQVNDYYIGLMELRKNHPAFRISTTEALVNNLVVCRSDGNVITYVLKNYANGDKWRNIAVVYNGNTSAVTADLTVYGTTWNVVVNDTKAGCEILTTENTGYVQVPGLSIMVLYDEETTSSSDISDFDVSKSVVTLAPTEETNIQIIYKDQNGAVLPKGSISIENENSSIVDAVIADTNTNTKLKITAKWPGTTRIKLTAFNESTGTETVKYITVTIININAEITPQKANSGENPVITVDTGNLMVSDIRADLSQVGGSSNYEISLDTKKISFGIKEFIIPGIKSIPITITDSSGKKYTIKTELEIVESSDAFSWEEAIIYFMVTDRFFDGRTANNGVLVKKEDPGAYHGGDFAGVTQKLDYLKELGVNTIWLTPIVDNTAGNFTTSAELAKGNNYYSYHGYWATDFKQLNPYLGSKEELCTLIEEAHDRGIKIMVDVVLNHAGYYSAEYPLKDQSIMKMLRDSSINQNDEIQWIAGLPDFETEKQTVRENVIAWQTAWAELKTGRGDSIDYFRVDTVKHVDHETWKQFKTALSGVNSSFKLIGEIFDSNAKIESYLNNGEMDSALDFDFKTIARQFVLEGKLDAAETALESRNARISNTALLGQFLSSHDEDGFLAVTLGGDQAKMMAAASLQITAKGQPVIYYGEEIGSSGANNWPIYDNRKDFDWNQVNNSNKMLNHYKKLLSIRGTYSDVFAKGNRRKVAGGDSQGYLIFSRSYQTDEVYVGINTTSSSVEVSFKTDSINGTNLTDLYSDKSYSVGENGILTITIPAMGDGGTVMIPSKVTWTPTPEPTGMPTPTINPSVSPTPEPTGVPTPTINPSVSPTPEPTGMPTPTINPSVSPTPEPTGVPTPTINPSVSPTPEPTGAPTPTINPSVSPTPEPTRTPYPTVIPVPTALPTPEPTREPDDIKEIVKTHTKKTKDNTTIETTTTTAMDKEGNRTVEKKIATVDERGQMINTVSKISVETKADGIIVAVETNRDEQNLITSQQAELEVTKPIITINQDNAEIIVNLPQQIEERIAYVVSEEDRNENLPVTVLLPTGAIINSLDKKAIQKITVIINYPEEDYEKSTPIQQICIRKIVLASLKQKQKDITIAVTGKDNKMDFQWSFEGKALKQSGGKLLDINLNLDVSAVNSLIQNEDNTLRELLSNDSNSAGGIRINFHHKGLLPATAEVKLRITEYLNAAAVLDKENKFYLYYYNKEINKLEALKNNVYVVDGNGYISISITNCSDYVLLPEKASKKIVTDLLDQIVPKSSQLILHADSKEKIRPQSSLFFRYTN